MNGAVAAPLSPPQADGGMPWLTLAELTAGAATSTGDPIQPALVAVQLHDVDWDSSLVRSAAEAIKVTSTAVVGVSRAPLPRRADVLLRELTCTLAPDAPGTTWVSDLGSLSAISARAAATPLATRSLVEVLRLGDDLHPRTALHLESVTYSMLLGGSEFARWRSGKTLSDPDSPSGRVDVNRDEDRLDVRLTRPARHNALDSHMRDALVDALDVAILDPTIQRVRISAAGGSFCSGGDLNEFGSADPVAAHVTRTSRSVATALLRLKDRVEVTLHGACIGAGIELPAFAGTVNARESAWFALPELGMGLIPGAGGTVSVAHRIGRHRLAWMVLSGERVDRDTALAWGLVDAPA